MAKRGRRHHVAGRVKRHHRHHHRRGGRISMPGGRLRGRIPRSRAFMSALAHI